MQTAPLPRQQILRRISDHLDQLAEEVHAIEHALGAEVSNLSRESSTIKRLQRLDFLRQSLEDTALLMHFLATEQPDQAQPDIARKLRLDTTRALMATDAAAGEAPGLGEVDLF